MAKTEVVSIGKLSNTKRETTEDKVDDCRGFILLGQGKPLPARSLVTLKNKKARLEYAKDHLKSLLSSGI